MAQLDIPTPPAQSESLEGGDMTIAVTAPKMSERDDDYSTFSIDNMMKVTDFHEMNESDMAELNALLAASV